MVLEQTLGAVILILRGGCPSHSVRIPQPTERQHIGNQIDAVFIFARADFGQLVRFLRFLEIDLPRCRVL